MKSRRIDPTTRYGYITGTCGAWTKRDKVTGERHPCKRHPCKGHDRCHRHGGRGRNGRKPLPPELRKPPADRTEYWKARHKRVYVPHPRKRNWKIKDDTPI